MRRELHEVLSELQAAVAPMAAAARAGVRIAGVQLSLPLDVSAVLRDGACVLLADVPRNLADASWWGPPTRLHVQLAAQALPDEAATAPGELS